MEITLRHIGSTIIEMTVEDMGCTITTDVTDLYGLVDENLIQNLRNIANELEEHNEKLIIKQ